MITKESIKRIGQKQAWVKSFEIDGQAPVKLLVSYSTKVAVATGSEGFYSNSYYYGGKSHTTGRHISVFRREFPGVNWHEVSQAALLEKVYQYIN